MRKSRKLIAVLATLALLATLLVPMVGPAAAATTYENVMSVQTFDKGDFVSRTTSFAKIKVTIPKAAMSLGATQDFYLRLPNDFYAYTCNSLVTVPGDVYSNQVASVTVTPIGTNTKVDTATGNTCDNEYRVRVTASTDATGNGEEGVFYIELQDLFIPSSATGDISAIIEAQPGTVFSDGSVVIARTTGGKVTVSIDDVKTITDANGAISSIRFKEDMAGALDISTKSVKVKLPKGFYWDTTSGTLSTKWGVGLGVVPGFTDYTDAANTKPRSVTLNVSVKSSQATYLELTGLVIKVDESEAKAGDVVCEVSGDKSTTVTPETLLVARYGEYKANVEVVGDVPTLLAGKENQKLGKWMIKEEVPNSLIAGRTITLTLPAGAKWDYDVDNGQNEYPTVKNNESELNSLVLWDGTTNWAWSVVDSERRILKATVRTPSTGTKPAKVVFNEGKIAIEPGFTGDLKVTVGGSAGASGELVLAKVKSPVEGAVATMKDVKIGYQDQVIDDLVITETKKEAIARNEAQSITLPGGTNGYLVIRAPSGVTFSTTPSAEVIEGDMDIEKIWASADRQTISIKVNATSDKISKIKVSNLKVSLDRTVPEGDLKFDLMGDALVSRNIWDDRAFGGTTYPAYFADSDVSSSVVVAKCVTPAPFEQKATVVFKISDTKYTVNGVEQTMDVAPYIKDGRTFVPVRYAAQAVGVAPENILYADGKVTLIKGDKVVQLTIGSNVMVINGVAVNMDVAAELSNDRTMLPFRWVAQALGAKVDWNPDTQTVTMEL